MITFKCKMCGGDLEFEQGATVAECPFCGTQQTLPKLDDDRRANLYDRANHFRRQNEYDKAMALYEKILQDDRSDAEAYWSLVLCRYGIEYVVDPASGKRVPTVNRVQYTSVLADEDYKSALQYADSIQRDVYRQEAATIDEIQKGILAISSKEEPFDVFICYKETDAAGRRTPDSVLANDLYHQLTREGFKVFFARITLEDKIGSAYEPYIFAALNSAKVMVVLGTKPEYFNAVWVRNEWSRFLALIKSGAEKTLVPAYRDMDPYDLPEEFSHLQAQDMSKLGFMQDLIHGIKKLTQKNEAAKSAQPTRQQVVAQGGVTVESLMKRAHLFLEDGDFQSANEYLNKVLDIDPEYAPAYIGKVQVSLKLRQEKDLASSAERFEENGDWKKALRFAAPEQKKVYEQYLEGSLVAREEQRKKNIYDAACTTLQFADTIGKCDEAEVKFKSISGYKDADSKMKECHLKSKQIAYELADRALKRANTNVDCYAAAQKFEALGDYKDSKQRVEECHQKVKQLEYDVAWSSYNQAKSSNTPGAYNAAAMKFAALGSFKDAAEKAQECEGKAIAIQDEAYAKAQSLLDSATYPADFKKAAEAFQRMNGYKDSAEKAELSKRKAEEANKAIQEKIEREKRLKAEQEAAAAKKRKTTTVAVVIIVILAIAAVALYMMVIKPDMTYKSAEKELAAGNYDSAHNIFLSLGDYKDSSTMVQESIYQKASHVLASGNHAAASNFFKSVPGYKDADTMALESIYQQGHAVLASGAYDAAAKVFNSIPDYLDAATMAQECIYQKATTLFAEGESVAAAKAYESISAYNDSALKAQEIHYNQGLQYLAQDNKSYALLEFRRAGDFKNSYDLIAELQPMFSNRIAGGYIHTVAITQYGNVIAAGNKDDNKMNIGSWSDIVAIAPGARHTIGLKVDGTVVATGSNSYEQCNVDTWSNITAIAAGNSHTIALKTDGTVVSTGSNSHGQCNIDSWTDIVAIAAGDSHTIGLKADGTVVATGSNDSGQCDISTWTDIVAIAAGDYNTLGLKADGTAIAVGKNAFSECNINDWTDIISISAGNVHSVGLKDDGTVVAVGFSRDDRCDTNSWTDIVAISAGQSYTIGLKADGTVVAIGSQLHGQCDVDEWDLW